MPAPTVNTSSNNPSATGSTFTVSAPAGITDGDLLLAFQLTNNGSSGPGTPTGWTSLTGQFFGTGPSNAMACFYKVAASEPGSYTFKNANALDTAAVYILDIVGADSTTLGHTNNTGGASTTIDSNVTGTTGLLTVVGYADHTNTTFALNNGQVDLGQLNTSLLFTLDVGYLASAAGSTLKATSGSSATWGAIAVTVPGVATPLVPKRIVVIPPLHPSYLE